MTIPTAAPHRDHIFHGVLFGCLAVFLLTAQMACAKILSATHHPIEIVFYRNLVTFIPLITYVAMARRADLLKTAKPLGLIFRTVIGTVNLVLTFAAFSLLPMADATVIILTSTLIVPALSFFFLDEHIGIRRWSAIVLGLLGVALIVQPTGHVQALGIFIAFMAAFFHSAIQVSLRHLKTESSFTVTFYFVMGGMILSGLFMPFIARLPAPGEFMMLLFMGAAGGFGQYCFTSSFRLAPASVIAPLNYTGLIWATLLDIFLWNYIPGFSVFVGAGIIIASQAYILHREKLAERRDNY